MAFDRNKISKMTTCTNNGYSHWSYVSNDSIADINTEGYFNNASDILNVNDTMIVISSVNTTPVHSTVIVKSIEEGVVDVSDGVSLTATDSD